MEIKAVFVAAPFWAYVDKETGEFDKEALRAITRILEHFDGHGCTVYNAHRREEWGQAFLEPEEFTVLDYQQICESDVVVAFPGSPASPGTHVELGWASANKVPIVLILEHGREYAGLVRGLREIGPVRTLEVTGDVDLAALDAAVSEVAAAGSSRSDRPQRP